MKTLHYLLIQFRRNSALYGGASQQLLCDSFGNYTKAIGDGLFSRKSYKVGDFIAEFRGEIISEAEYCRRVRNGKGGYAIRICATRKLLGHFNGQEIGQ